MTGGIRYSLAIMLGLALVGLIGCQGHDPTGPTHQRTCTDYAKGSQEVSTCE